jgi:DNA-binding response OmpR family regulator
MAPKWWCRSAWSRALPGRTSLDDKILVVDDETLVRDVIAGYLKKVGFNVERCSTVEEAISALEKDEYAIVVTDKNMLVNEDDEEGGMVLLAYIKKHLPNTEVIMVTGYATVETAIQAMRMGAFDYVVKPFKPEDLKQKIDRIIACRSFLNPERAVSVYKTFHDNVLKLLEKSIERDDKALLASLQSLEESIDSFVLAQKEWERIILFQQEALGRISFFAEQLSERLGDDAQSTGFLEGILSESMKRI